MSGLRELAAQATPGPWVTANGGQTVKNEEHFDWVATAQVSNVPEWRENARLVALVPEMAVLLDEVFTEHWEDIDPELRYRFNHLNSRASG